mgnify:CR=1 FL=1
MNIYIYDDTFEGLLTSIYNGFYSKIPPTCIYSKKENNTPLLLGEIIEIQTDFQKFNKVKNAIINKIDALCLKKTYLVYLSNHEEKGMLIFKYLKTAFKLGKDCHAFLNLEIIRLVDTINRRVSFEAVRLKGFIRFKSINDKFLYSSIEPDNDILELIGDHFKNRFKNEYFIIHDISREKAIVYNKISYEIIDMSIDDYEKLNVLNDEYTTLWSAYFKSTTITERENHRLQRQMMPKRYWKHIFETNN